VQIPGLFVALVSLVGPLPSFSIGLVSQVSEFGKFVGQRLNLFLFLLF
jgi:hypothetical protein